MFMHSFAAEDSENYDWGELGFPAVPRKLNQDVEQESITEIKQHAQLDRVKTKQFAYWLQFD